MDVVFFDGNFYIFPIRIIFENLSELDAEIIPNTGY